MARPLDFDQTLAELDRQERLVARAMVLLDRSIQDARVLPWPIRSLLIWKCERLQRRGTANLLRMREARDQLLEHEAGVRPIMARRAIWG